MMNQTRNAHRNSIASHWGTELLKKRLITGFCGVALAASMTGAAHSQSSSSALTAQSFPSQPVRLILPFPPGGAVDPIARLLSQKLGEAWGKPVLVENRPGAGGIVATEFVARSAPDGHIVTIAVLNHAVNPWMYKLPYDSVKDFSPISLIGITNLLLVVNAQVPVNSVAELIQLAKKQPGKLNAATAGVGTSTHLAAALFNSVAGTEIMNVAYKGSGPAMTSILAGETTLGFDSLLNALPQIKGGRVKGLAVAGAKRSPLAPDLPTVAESGLPGFEAYSWTGVLAPAKTPRDIVQKWSQEIARVVQSPDVRDRLINQGVDPVGNTPEQFTQFIEAEIKKWGAVVQQAGIKPE